MVKVFILERKFKLAIKYLMMTKREQFQIEFFTLAIRSGCYCLAFYLYSKYENEIV